MEANRVSTGLLQDYGIDFVNVQNYDGIQVTDSNMVSTNVWDDLYTSLYTYRFNNVMAGMAHPDTVFAAIRAAESNNRIPLSLLFMRYDKYLDNAASAGLVAITGDQLYDKYVSGVWQNPYQQKTAIMEINNQNHQARLFVSLDAPYLGANVPLGLQALNTHLASTKIKVGLLSGTIGYVSTVGSLANQLQVYSTPAARELLTYYVKANPVNGSLSMDNAAHNTLVTMLKTLGYPQNCRNVAIANGSECATPLPVSPGTDLLRLSGGFGTTA